ncbi:MAG: hypothetical protein BGO49_07665 [Planctomycetales bacterium 71-10]|nr:MAG: hypothetical protein BGO49_07665 [Planctomycetales bacterium 71-10]
MSGPKRSQASLDAERREQERLRLQREAEEAAELRRAEEERLARVRLKNLRDEATVRAAEVARDVASVLAGPAGRFLPEQRSRELLSESERLGGGGGDASTEGAARDALRALEDLGAEWRRLKADARSLGETETQLTEELRVLDGELTGFLASPTARYATPEARTAWSDCVRDSQRLLLQARTGDQLRAAATAVAGVRGEFSRGTARSTALRSEAEKLVAEIRGLRSRWAGFRSSSLAVHLPVDRADEVAKALDAAESSAAAAATWEAFESACAEGETARRVLAGAEAEAKAAELSASLEAEAAELAKLRQLVAGLDPAASSRFDDAGRRTLEDGLGRSQSLIESGQLDSARTELERCRNAWSTHYATVTERRGQFLERQRAANLARDEALALVDSVRESPELARWVAKDVAALSSRLAELDNQVRRDQFAEAVATAREVAASAQAVAARAVECHGLDEAIREVEGGFRAEQDGQASGFDTAGARQVEKFLEASRLQLSRSDTRACAATIETARARLRLHVQTVAREASRWHGQRDDALATIATARDKVSSLRAHTIAFRWMRPRIEELERDLATAESLVRDGKFDAARKQALRLPAEADRVIADAEPRQQQANIQERIVEGIEQAMVRLGLSVESGPQSEDDPGSPHILHATRQDRAKIYVLVEQSGAIRYEVDEELKREERDDVGRPVHRCDEAESQILRMNKLLKEFGILAERPTWPGMPNRPPGWEEMEFPETDEGERPEERPGERQRGARP